MPEPISEAAQLRASIDALADVVDRVPFLSPNEARYEGVALREGLGWTLREYLLNRLKDVDSPARIVVVGSTGSGKSTLLNSIAQMRVTEPGALRPTTRLPVLWCHQRYEAEFAFNFLTGYGTGADAEQPMKIVAGLDPLLEGLSILDAPDFDSVEETHHRIADELLAIADLCIFVTSAQRYADAVPWEFLDKARRRGIPVVHVMNRIPMSGADDAVADYKSRLEEREVPIDMFLTIAEQPLDPDHGGVAPQAIEPLTERLGLLADPEQRRRLVVEATQTTLEDALNRVDELTGAIRAEREHVAGLVGAAEAAYTAQYEEIERDVADGNLIRRQVVERWEEFIGTGEMMKAVTDGVSRARDWFVRVMGGQSSATRVEVQVRGELHTVLVRRAGLAAKAAAGAWDLDPVGTKLVAERRYEFWHEAPETEEAAIAAIDDWMAGIADMINQEGGDKKRWAQVASAGVNAVAVSAMVAVFVNTSGLTGTEVGIAAGAAAVQQKILEYVFGSAAAKSMVETGKRRLELAIRDVLWADMERFRVAAHALAAPEGLEEELENAAAAVVEQGIAFYGT